MVMAEQEIVRTLRMIRYSHQGPQSRKAAPGLRSIARAAGLSHMTLYRAIYTGEISNKSAAALGKVLDSVTFGLNQNSRSP
jgi:DNA-binding phage protein